MVHESGQDPVELAWGRSVSCITAVKVRQTDRRCTSQTSVAAKSTNRGLGAAGERGDACRRLLQRCLLDGEDDRAVGVEEREHGS